MRDILSRLRAALTPQALAWVAALLLLASSLLSREGASSSLEKRIERTLSAIEGAGRVEVVINSTEATAGGGLSSAVEGRIVVGAVAVAQGADDPVVQFEIEQALCTLLNLPPTAVSVMKGVK